MLLSESQWSESSENEVGIAGLRLQPPADHLQGQDCSKMFKASEQRHLVASGSKLEGTFKRWRMASTPVKLLPVPGGPCTQASVLVKIVFKAWSCDSSKDRSPGETLAHGVHPPESMHSSKESITRSLQGSSSLASAAPLRFPSRHWPRGTVP